MEHAFIKKSLIAATALCIICAPDISHAWKTGKELTQVTFSSVDTNQDDQLSLDEIKAMVNDSAYSIDADQSNSISLDEFTEWDFGYYYLAEQEGNLDHYKGVKKIMFNLVDLNQDGKIEPKEMDHAADTDFHRADFDDDDLLSKTEFNNGWTPVVILRASKK